MFLHTFCILLFTYCRCLWINMWESATLAASRNLLAMLTLRTHPDILSLKLNFHKISSWFLCALKCEKHFPDHSHASRTSVGSHCLHTLLVHLQVPTCNGVTIELPAISQKFLTQFLDPITALAPFALFYMPFSLFCSSRSFLSFKNVISRKTFNNNSTKNNCLSLLCAPALLYSIVHMHIVRKVFLETGPDFVQAHLCPSPNAYTMVGFRTYHGLDLNSILIESSTVWSPSLTWVGSTHEVLPLFPWTSKQPKAQRDFLCPWVKALRLRSASDLSRC